MKKSILIPVFLLAILSSKGNTIILEGGYKGHNLYFLLSPCGTGLNSFQITINDSIKDSLKTRERALELNLSKYAFPLQSKIKVRITSSDSCQLKLLNSDMGDISHPAKFLSIAVSKDGKTLKWSALEDTSRFNYVIEQYRWNRWVKMGTVSSHGKNDTLSDTFPISEWIHSGDNKFRVKACTPFCFYSPVATLEGPIKSKSDHFNHRYTGTPLQLPRESHYELYDGYGNLIKKGFGKTVDLKGTGKGLYYLCYDNEITEVLNQ
jgi:hypothetical protein